MALVGYVRLYKDELVCDLAETYHIYDMRAFQPSYIFVLISGLRADSRTKMKMREARISFPEELLVAMYDRLNWLVWSKTRAAQKGRGQPESILQKIYAENDHVESFDSAEEFEIARARILGGGQNG